MRVTLSLWDIAGQERFSFFKTDFFNGVATVALVFDLSRPDTLENIDEYFKDLREHSGNIPIILVGNKNDLKKDIGEAVPKDKILQKLNQYNLFEFIETSALEKNNVDKLFYRLALISLLDFKARLGEIINSDHFRFKILLVGEAAVGKSSLIKSFVNKEFEADYKLTVGLDFMTQDLEIRDDDLPKETQDLIKKSVKEFRKLTKKLQKREELEIIQTDTGQFLIKDTTLDNGDQETLILEGKEFIKSKKSRKCFIILFLIIIAILIVTYVYLTFFR
ncbi:MAG: GTP-binding protein [Promethearchaeota archaeon]